MGINGSSPLDDEPDNKRIVEYLEKALEGARAGHIQGLVIMMDVAGGDFACSICWRDARTLLGSLQELSYEICRKGEGR